MHMTKFSIVLQNAVISPVILVKSDFITNTVTVILKIHRVDNSNCLKASLLKTFFWEFSGTFKTANFPNIFWKLYGVTFLKRGEFI